MEDPIRVLVADDTSTYRKIVRDVLAAVPGISVVGSAANGKMALDKIGRLSPDILTLDLEMPEMGGLEVLRRLQQAHSEVGVIVLSGSSQSGADETMTALELGAFDFVAKPNSGDAKENATVLGRELRQRIDSFIRKRKIRELMASRGRIAPIAKPALPAAGKDDVGKRMARCSRPGQARPELIVVGISTGGPQALNHMLPMLPADLPVPVLIVQHMPPVFTKSLADGLNKHCALSVSEAVDGEPVLPGHILIAPGGKQMKVIKQGVQAMVRLTADAPENSCRPSVDYLFRSVASIYGSNAVGVIMTGMGNDGAQGCRQLKRSGAAIIAQDAASCVVFGMPREPIEEGVADVVVPLDEIAREIVRLSKPSKSRCK